MQAQTMINTGMKLMVLIPVIGIIGILTIPFTNVIMMDIVILQLVIFIIGTILIMGSIIKEMNQQ